MKNIEFSPLFFFFFLTLSIVFYSSSFGSCELHVCVHVCVLFSEKAAMPVNLVNSNKVQQQQQCGLHLALAVAPLEPALPSYSWRDLYIHVTIYHTVQYYCYRPPSRWVMCADRYLLSSNILQLISIMYYYSG